ncbi:MAG: metallophosphoesterase, partial [Woeseiaceae bacterium]
MALLFALAGCNRNEPPRPLEMPDLRAADYYWIASRIFENETGGKLEYLTHWNEGEDFPSMGIGHFIWFPEGVDAPFDESFPRMLEYVKGEADECAPVPDWLAGDEVPDAPWPDKTTFDSEGDSDRISALREWLAATAPEQSRYIVASFASRWNALELEDKERLTEILQRLLGTPRGLFAVIDYFNFKGLGSNPRERYAGEGWGLVQVLGDIAPDATDDDAQLVELFSQAAAARLALRVANSPPDRNEARWLPGWDRRVAAYADASSRPVARASSAFRVRPYVADLAANRATITWFSESGAAGSVRAPDGTLLTSEPRRACELAYHLAEFGDLDGAGPVPWRHSVAIDNLEPGAEYRIAIQQEEDRAAVLARTPSPDATHFVVYADVETEPESTGAHVAWPAADNEDRRYLVDQTTGYAANLEAIAARRPEFIAIAGDLVESGGEQRDWDEFWRHNGPVAATTPIVPALGNHDYYGGPGDLGGYGEIGVSRALARFRAYFEREPFYVHEHGPVALIVIDTNNGLPERSPQDTNWYLDNMAPPWQPSSPQYEWLERALAEAQREKAFTFVMFHPSPYTSGIHGRPPGVGDGQNFSSGLPLRALTPLFLRYGVDAVFNGHDEMYEHSVVDGT